MEPWTKVSHPYPVMQLICGGRSQRNHQEMRNTIYLTSFTVLRPRDRVVEHDTTEEQTPPTALHEPKRKANRQQRAQRHVIMPLFELTWSTERKTMTFFAGSLSAPSTMMYSVTYSCPLKDASLDPLQPDHHITHNQQFEREARMNTSQSSSSTDTVNFMCGVCTDVRSEASPRTINSISVCKDCVNDAVLPLFHKALNSEFFYPPQWDSETLLDPEDFEEELGKDFIKRFVQVEKEYQTPPSERLYCKCLMLQEEVLPRGQRAYGIRCIRSFHDEEMLINEGRKIVQCGGFIGTRKPFNNGSIFLQPNCYSCGGKACTNCGEPIHVGHVKFHQCSLEEEDIVGPEMKKGKDYQQCPNPKCGTIVQLHDGCNYILCNQTSCNWGFCFVCGEGPLEDSSSHWRPGRPCPRFGQPGTARALWDEHTQDGAPPQRAPEPHEMTLEQMIAEGLVPPEDEIPDLSLSDSSMSDDE